MKMCTENHLHFDYVRLAWDAGFCFEEYNTKNAFDISTIGLVDIEKVTRDRDIATVEKHIPTILQFHLDEELTRILEPTFVKIFKLCQLALQYLRFCNKYLDNTVVILKKDLSAINEENMNLSNIVEQLKTENSNLNIQHKELKEAFNHVNQTVSYRCHECSKSFASEDYLQAHVARRHDSPIQTESEKLQLEIKELKERLNSTEKYEKGEPNNDDVFGDKEAVLQAKFEQLKEHIEKELSLLKDESFYKGIYEKWFEEVFEKLNVPSRKVLVERAAGDFVRVAETATQTSEEAPERNDGLKGGFGDIGSTAFGKFEEIEGRTFEKIGEIEERTFEKIEEIEGRTIGRIEEIEQRLKVDNEAQRELLENMLEQKIVGTLGKLETQMSDFGRKLQHFEMKKEVIPKPVESAITNNEARQTNAKFIKQNVSSTKTDTRYISAKSTHSSDSEGENIPPKPAARTFAKPPVKVRSFKDREKQENERFSDKIEAASKAEESESISEEIDFGNSTQQTSKESIQVEQIYKNVEINVESTSEDSEDFRVIKTVAKSKDVIQTVLRENVQKRLQRKEDVKTGYDSEPKKYPKKATTKHKAESKSADDVFLKSKQDEVFKRPREDSLVVEIKEKQKKLNKNKQFLVDSDSIDGASKTSGNFPEKRLEDIQDELEDFLNLRLKDIGVAPQWKGLPMKNYEHAIKVVDHQSSLLSKMIPNFTKIRGGLVKIINRSAKKEASSELKSTKCLRETNKPRKHKNEQDGDVVDITTDQSSNYSDDVPKHSKGANKKKVLFNLKKQDSVRVIKNAPSDFAGSVSSLDSSVLDDSPEKRVVGANDWSINDTGHR